MNPLASHRQGETPLDDLSGLRDRSIRTRADLDAAEFVNIQSALLRHMTSARRSPSVLEVRWMLRLHRDMFGKVWRWAGRLRRHDTNIGVQPALIEPQLHDLCADLQAWQLTRMSCTEQGARLHHRAVFIHPFTNGNGRWARLLANIWLMRQQRTIVRWPEQTIGADSPIRDEYLRAIRAADRGNLDPLIAMHASLESAPFTPD